MPFSEAEAQDGPRSAIILLRSAGRQHFIIPSGTLFSRVEAAAALFILCTVTAMVVAMLELHFSSPMLPLALTAAAIYGCYWLIRRHLSQQHLEISATRLLWYRSFRGRKLGLQQRDIAPLPMEGAIASSGRYRLRLFPGHRPLDLICSGPREGKWLEALLTEASKAAPAERRCPGCGAPLETPLVERARGLFSCPYCDAGLSMVADTLQWATLRLPRTDPPPSRPGPQIQPVKGGWTFPADQSSLCWLRGFSLLPAILLITAMGAFLLWGSFALRPPAVSLTVFMLLAGAGMLAFAGALARLAVTLVVSRLEITLDDARLRFDTRLGSWRAPPRSIFPDAPAGDRPEQTHGNLPLYHLVEVSFEQEPSSLNKFQFTPTSVLRLCTPTRFMEICWNLPSTEDRWLRHQLINEIRKRLKALDRDVQD